MVEFNFKFKKILPFASGPHVTLPISRHETQNSLQTDFLSNLHVIPIAKQVSHLLTAFLLSGKFRMCRSVISPRNCRGKTLTTEVLLRIKQHKEKPYRSWPKQTCFIPAIGTMCVFNKSLSAIISQTEEASFKGFSRLC